MRKVVLDTNIFVSSFFSGNPRKIIDLWKSGGLNLCLSRSIMEEYVEVLKRFGLEDEKELGELLNLFAHGYHILFASKTPKVSIVKDDPDDDKFIECAVAVKADTIISGDKKLLAIKNYMGISIVTPKDFLDEM